MKAIHLFALAVFCASVFFTNGATAGIVTFFGDGSTGTGLEGSSSFVWTATPGDLNPRPVIGANQLDWGIGGDPTSTGLNFDIVMTFPVPWHFNFITFGSLNTLASQSEFSVQLFDATNTAIDISSLTASTTSGFGSSPWSYNNINNKWSYSTIGGSINAHEATLAGLTIGVKKIVVEIDDHFGIDTLRLDMTAIPEPSSLTLVVLACAGMLIRRRSFSLREPSVSPTMRA
jgi:hypothetical protein